MSSFNPSYTGPRLEILERLPAKAESFLDVGCSNGEVGSMIKTQNNNARVVGIEYDAAMADEASKRLDQVIVGDLNAMDLDKQLQGQSFDCIIMADVLEHLVDPWTTLSRFTQFLNENGVVIISIPNIRHVSTIATLVFKGYWPYRDRGIHDRTHLRFFTLRNIRELISSAGLNIHDIQCNYRIFDIPHAWNRLARLLAFWPFKGFVAYQYIVVVSRSR